MEADLNKEKALLQRAFKYGLEYLEQVDSMPVIPQGDSLQLLMNFEEEKISETGVSPEAILKLLHISGAPNTVAQTGGRYFGFVNGATLPIGLAASIIADFWDQNSALEVMSPVVSRLEAITEKWLADLFGLPEDTAAGFVSGTSVASFCCLAAARYHLYNQKGWDIEAKGLYGAVPLRIVTGEDVHASVIKALHLLGFGSDHIVKIPCDAQGRVMPDQLPLLDDMTIVVLQAGNVNSGAFDPFKIICERAKSAGSWVHIDGAFGLWAAASSHFDKLTEGLSMADSWAVDAHKTLNAPYDSGILLCRNRKALLHAMAAQGDYIVHGNQRDGMYYTPEMSRRSRIIALWAILKFLGKAGLAALVDRLHNHALTLGSLLREMGYSVMNEIVFNQIMIRYQSDEKTMEVLRYIQSSGVLWCGPSRWKGEAVIRISICSWRTDDEDIRKAAETFQKAI